MEDVLDLYAEPLDPTRPRVCVDEVPVQLLADPHAPTRCAPGTPARQDFSYLRRGTANLFVAYAHDQSWRTVRVTARRTKRDFADFLKALVDEHFPEAQTIRLVVDNLNTHVPGALYAAFPPAEARRIARKLEWHYTPKHASWLNMVELENSVLSRQCLGRRRIPDYTTLVQAVAAWVAPRNAAGIRIAWRFTTHDARRKLTRLYPDLAQQDPDEAPYAA